MPGSRIHTAPGGAVPLDHVLVVMMSAVGDVVHVLPVLQAIKRVSPATKITWVLQAGPATLVRGHPLVDEIVLFDRTAGLRGFRDIRRALASRPASLVLNLQVYFKAGIITSFTQSAVKLGFDRARARHELVVHHAPRAGPRNATCAGPVPRVLRLARRAV